MSRTIRVSFRSVFLLLVALTACSKKPSDVKIAATKQGDDLVRREQYGAAILAYRTALQADPHFAETRLKLADTYVKAKDLVNAAREYRRAADGLPNDWELQLKVGRLLLASGAYEDAKTKAQQVLAAQPSNVDAQLLRGNALAGLKDLDSAIKDLEEAVRMDPTRAQSQATLGAAQMRRGNHAEAEAAFRRAVALDPRSVQARLALANFFVHENRADDAEAAFKGVFELEPKNLSANRYLALRALTSGRPADAETHLQTMANDGSGDTRLALAEYYAAMNRSDDARRILTGLASDPKTFAAATIRLAELEFGTGSAAAAARLVDELLIREPKSAEALVLAARIALARHDVPTALDDVTRAVAAAPDSASAQFVMGTVHATRGDSVGARKAFLESLRINPRMTMAFAALARLSLMTGAYQESRSHAEEALRVAPADPEARLVHARALVGLGDVARAEAESTALIKDYPGAADAQVALGSVYFAKHAEAAGVQLMNRALELDPANFDALQALVMLDIHRKNVESARARIDRRLAETPKTAPLLLLGAATYVSTGDAATAEKFLKEAIEIDSANLRAYAMLGNVYAVQHRLSNARAEFENIVAREPHSVPALTMVAVLLDMERKPGEAEAAYEKVLSVDAHAAVAANNLAWLLAESGRDLGRALTLAQTAKAQLGENPSIDDTLGWIYFKVQMYPSAVAALEASVDRAGDDPVIRYHLGLAYAKAGELAKSKAQLTRALQMNPNTEFAAEARRVLATIGG
jgi:tetratricopeptide (TPR) repeat protein